MYYYVCSLQFSPFELLISLQFAEVRNTEPDSRRKVTLLGLDQHNHVFFYVPQHVRLTARKEMGALCKILQLLAFLHLYDT